MYKYSLQHFGLATFWLTNQYTFNLATAGTIVGIIPLLTGGYVAVQAFTQEKNTAIHAITAAILTITAAILLHIIPFETGILLLSIFLIVLLAPAGELLFAARQRSRIPSIHTIAVLVIGLAFIFTNVVPAIALGTEALNSTPKIYDYKAREVLQLTTQKKSIILWDAQHASFLEEKGFQTVIGQSPLQNPKSKEISAAVGNLSIYQTEIQLIRALNTYEVTAIVIPKNSKLPLSERCFEPLYRSEVEVYKLTCVVQ